MTTNEAVNEITIVFLFGENDFVNKVKKMRIKIK